MNWEMSAIAFVLGYWGVPLVVLGSLVIHQWATDRNIARRPVRGLRRNVGR